MNTADELRAFYLARAVGFRRNAANARQFAAECTAKEADMAGRYLRAADTMDEAAIADEAHAAKIASGA